MNAYVNQSGKIEVAINSAGWTVGHLDTYEFNCVKQMHMKASTFSWVRRPNGKYIPGSKYTYKMAINDWSATVSD